MSIIELTLYAIIIAAISLLFLLISCTMTINPISGITINLFCLITVLYFKSYSLFYISLIVAIILSYRNYNCGKNITNSKKLVCIFTFNLISICSSIYVFFQMTYYHLGAFSKLKYIPADNILIIKAAPIAYVLMIYVVCVVLLLSIYNYLSVNSSDNAQIVLIKTAAYITIIILLIIVVNALVYFIIHNFSIRQRKGIFAGNFLKDSLEHYSGPIKPFSDCLWFSATTFFTVGYGDMHPVGNIMYLITTLQMISAYILGIIMIPILLFKVPNSEHN